MAVFQCKMCGGDLTLMPGSNLAVCQYCGSQQTVPAIDDDKKARLYNRANRYRLDCEFDKAYNAYESIVNDEPTEAEAYWGLVLSEYGVEYVYDPKTGKKIPTCHRTLTRSVTANENYKSACRNSDSERRIFYEEEAETLDALQKRVLNASAKEEPYDVFICYKETDDNGVRTADSVLAQEIYDALTNKGLRVFFSRISLEDKLGADYEPCIFAALNSAKVMLMVTTDTGHCNSVWVKNEWKRYLDFMKNDSSKTLIPVYKDISPYALPDEFSRFQAQDMGKLGAMQDLVRGVEKLTGKQQKSGGLTKEEKETLCSVQKSQSVGKFIGLALAVLLAGTFAITWTAAAFLDKGASLGSWIVLTKNGSAVDLFQCNNNGNLFLLSAAFALPLACMMSWVSHGIRSKFAGWTLTAAYLGVCLVLMLLQCTGKALGPVLWVLLAVYGVLTCIGTILANRQEKKKLVTQLLILLAALTVTVLVGLV